MSSISMEGADSWGVSVACRSLRTFDGFTELAHVIERAALRGRRARRCHASPLVRIRAGSRAHGGGPLEGQSLAERSNHRRIDGLYLRIPDPRLVPHRVSN